MGKSERHSLESAVEHLFVHLLKTKDQPHLAGTSWQASIKKQRKQIAKIITESKLKPLLTDAAFIADVYYDAVLAAVIETGLPEATFPSTCPFSLEDVKVAGAEITPGFFVTGPFEAQQASKQLTLGSLQERKLCINV